MGKRKSSASIPQTGEGKRGESGHIGYLLRQAAGANRLRMERALADLQVTPAQFSVLTMLAAYPGVSNADLARLALLTPQTVSLIVSNLERMAVVSRRPHAVHGRVQHLDINARGRALLSRCRSRARAIDRALVAGMTASEERAVRAWLVRVASANADQA